MNISTRRQFLTKGSQTALGATMLPAICQGDHHKESRFQIGLSQYSLRAMFKDGSLDPLDFPKFTADTFGIKAIDLWEGGLPGDKLDDAAYLEKMKANAAKAGTELFLLMSGVFDATPSDEARVANDKSIVPSLGRAEKLGCEFVRIFLKAPGDDAAQGVKASAEALKPLADAAAKKKLIIAIEPAGSSLSEKGAFLAKVAKKLDHPALRLMPDFGKLKGNVYDGTEAMMPYTATVSAKMHSFDDAGNQPDFDYNRLMKIISASKYKGIIAIEWEGSKLKPVEGVMASQKLIAKSLGAL